MVTTILFIIAALGIGIYHTDNKPTEYEISMEDGSITHVVLKKNSSYACPIYCEIDHIHHAVVYKDENQIAHNQFVYHISEKNENGISFYCSTKKILSMSKFVAKTSKDNLPDVVSASSEE
tara:strand:+ start:42 stop:404 length:363 start_codon:yes stop_codon:yes gene_type:complete